MSKTSKELLQEVHTMLAEYFLEELKIVDTIPYMERFVKNRAFTFKIKELDA